MKSLIGSDLFRRNLLHVRGICLLRLKSDPDKPMWNNLRKDEILNDEEGDPFLINFPRSYQSDWFVELLAVDRS